MTPVVLTPSAGVSAPTAPAAGHPVLATVPDAPPAAARLEAGSIIAGTVLGRDSQGHVAIRTDRGVLALQTNANLPVGAQVSLEVRVAGARLQLVVLSVELPPGQAGQVTPGQTAPGHAASGHASTGGAVPPAAGQPTPPLPTPTPPGLALALALGGGGLVMATVVHSSHAGAAGQPTGTLPPPPGQALAGQPGAGPTPAGGGVPGQPAVGQVIASQPVSGQGTPGQGTPAHGLPGQGLPGQGLPGALLPGNPAGPTPNAVAPGPIAPGPIALGLVAPGTVFPGAAAAPAATGLAGQGPAGQGPASGPVPASAPIPGAAATPSNLAPALAASGGAAAGAPPQALAPGSEIGVRILSAALPGAAAPTPGAPPAPGVLQVPATVVAQAPNGQPVVDSPLGPMVLAVKGALPIGATLLLEIPPQAADPALGPAVTSTQQALLRLVRGWPALESALAAFGAAGDAASAQALAARLPQTGPGLGAGLLSLIAQYAAGEGAEFLSPALREALEKAGKRDLADRLNGEFRQIGRLAAEPAGGDWRVMFLPLRHEGELHQINLYLRGRRKDGGRDGPDTGTRFVVEVDMTRLGPIQLDGLVHGRRFDLMLRSRAPLSAAVRRDIEAIFDEARGIGGFAGSIGFQVAASFPVKPLEQAKRMQSAAGVVV